MGVQCAKHVDPAQLLRYNIGSVSGSTIDATIQKASLYTLQGLGQSDEVLEQPLQAEACESSEPDTHRESMPSSTA
jgi:hypothetical protein